MKVYIATGLNRAKEAEALAVELAQLGHEITYAWWTHGSVQAEGQARIAEVAKLEADGVERADLVIVLLPGARGTHTELGMAIGFGRQVLIVGERFDDAGRECAFYYSPNVLARFETGAELTAWLRGLDMSIGRDYNGRPCIAPTRAMASEA